MKMTMNLLRPLLLSTALTAALAGCGSSDGPDEPPVACAEDGPYACKTGATEPLYTFQ